MRGVLSCLVLLMAWPVAGCDGNPGGPSAPSIAPQAEDESTSSAVQGAKKRGRRVQAPDALE